MRRSVVRSAAALALAGLLGACAGTAGPRDASDLTNVRLSPAWSQWLVGAIGEMATPEEIRTYLSLESDAASEELVESFWERRDPDPARPGNRMRALFEARAEVADRQYSEAGYLGRRTARGTIFVLHGPPNEVRFESPRRPGGPPVEVWVYGQDREDPSLVDRPPQRWYRFVQEGDLTVRYKGPGTPGSPPRNRF